MKPKSIKLNIMFNAFRTGMSMVFPLISFSYSSRILSPDGLGEVQFSQSIIAYFILIAMLGVNNYGIREGAKLRDDKQRLTRFFAELLSLNLFSTIISYMLFCGSLLVIPELRNYKELLLIFSTTILGTALGVEWFYGAIEEYGYIAIRSFVFQIISLICLFLFVRTREDVWKYAVIQAFGTVGSNLINFIHVRKYIERYYLTITFKKHIKPVLILFVMALTISLYANMDSTMLGFLTDDYEVGLYSAAVKINKIVVHVLDSIGIVLLPRLSYYYENRELLNFNRLVYKTIQYLLFFAIPATIGLALLSEEILNLFSGKEYRSAIITMQILTPIVTIIPLNTVINSQIFLPMNKEKWVLISTSVSAVTNLMGNFILIPDYGRNGAAIATVLAEAAGLVICLIFAKRIFAIRKLFTDIWKYCLGGGLMIPIAIVIKNMFDNDLMHIFLIIPFCTIEYFILLYLLKNDNVMEIVKYIKRQ